jgi:ADP-ribosyl-[dinitrogen reductase] hydrolase
MPTRCDRLTGGLIGLLVGDALGVPYEFHLPEELPPIDQIEFIPPPGFDRAHEDVPPGTWSDDGAQALCLVDSLLALGRFDAEDFGQRLLRWYDEGYLAADGVVFDIGIQTGNALSRLRAGVPPLDAGSAEERALGNGSLMRVLPLALWHRGSDAALVADARAQSRLTHGHARAQLCCALYCLWARRILDEAPDPWVSAVAALRALLPEGSADRAELEYHIRPDDQPSGTGSGYVVDTLRSARMVQDVGGYEAIVKAAVILGNDTDTTACVAGGIAGIRYGMDDIPVRWRESLRGQELVDPLLQGLLERG